MWVPRLTFSIRSHFHTWHFLVARLSTNPELIKRVKGNLCACEFVLGLGRVGYFDVLNRLFISGKSCGNSLHTSAVITQGAPCFLSNVSWEQLQPLALHWRIRSYSEYMNCLILYNVIWNMCKHLYKWKSLNWCLKKVNRTIVEKVTQKNTKIKNIHAFSF